MLSPLNSQRRLSKSGSGGIVQLVNRGETSPCLLINPVFTITANNWAATCDEAASYSRRCYPKVRQKSKSSGASPQKYPQEISDEFINIIQSTGSVDYDQDVSIYEDYGDSYLAISSRSSNSNSRSCHNSNPYLGQGYYYGSNKLLQVPSQSNLLLPSGEDDRRRQQRSSSITVPIQHESRREEKVNVGMRRCSSASPKGRYNQYNQQIQQQYQQTQGQGQGQRSNRSPGRGRERGFSLTITNQNQLLPDSGKEWNRRGSQTKRRRSSGYHRERRASAQSTRSNMTHLSSSSSSLDTPSHSPRHPIQTQTLLKSPFNRQRTHSMPNYVPLNNEALSRRNSHLSPTVDVLPESKDDPVTPPETSETLLSTPDEKETSDLSSNTKSSKSLKSKHGSYDVVIIGSPNVGKSTLAEYFNNSGKSGTSGSDQGIGSEEEDSYDDQDLSGKAIVFKPQGELNQQRNFSLRIFCQQTSAVTHLYKYDAVIILYSVTDRDSFEFARKALSEIVPYSLNKEKPKKVVILVGNKSDLERSRCISPLEGRSLATAYDCKFIEISSSLDVGIEALQKGLATQVYLRLAAGQKVKENSNSSSSSSSSTTSSFINSNKNDPGQGQRRGSKKRKSHTQTALNSLKLAQKLIDRIMSLRFSNPKSKSCLDLHSL